MKPKDIFLAIIAVLIPILYTAVIGRFSDFPLQMTDFTELVLWVVGLIFGGNQGQKIIKQFKDNK